MTRAPVSPVFVGRETELTELLDAYQSVREDAPLTVLLGGEAGVGKTRLVIEFAARVRETGAVRVLAGGCLELSSAGLPYAPFTAALRGLVREIGADGVAKLMPGGGSHDLARLLPGLAESPGHDYDPDTGRLRLFEQLLTLLERLAERAPLVFVVEDAHWADQSTRDLLAFLARNLRHGPVLLLVTYRTDELHRTHPLRPLLAELGRLATVTRTELPRLTRGEVSVQLGGIFGRPVEPFVVEDVYRRSAGIPLFVEATADCADQPAAVPTSLRDLLMTGVQRLPEETQDVLRVASAGGDHVRHDLLAAVTGLDDRRLTAALRPAVDRNVLVADADGYAFRHALIREAVHEDLLPGEHSRTHRRYAEALEDDPGLSGDRSPSAALALHWSSAHDYKRALLANWRAAAESAAALAYAEQLHMLEWVLEVWDRVPDAPELIGSDQVTVLELAVEAAQACGEPDRGLAFVRAALAELDETRDADRIALLLMHRSWLRRQRGLPGDLDDLRAAERLAARPTQARARVLARFTSQLMLANYHEEVRSLGREGIELARRLGDEESEIDILVTLTTIEANDGAAGGEATAVQALREARARADRIGDRQLATRALVNLSHILEGAGEHDLAIEVSKEGFELAKQSGLARTKGTVLAANLTESLVSAGRWAEADAIADEAMALNPVPSLHGYLLMYQGELAIARGDAAAAARAMEAIPRSFQVDAGLPQELLPHLRLLIDWRLAEGDLSGALDHTARGVEVLHDCGQPRFAWPILATGMRACATVRSEGARDEKQAVRAAELRDALRDAATRVSAAGAVPAAYAATFAAESARADGRLDHSAWDATVTAWEALGRPYPLAYALFQAAEALLTTPPESTSTDGHREGAAERLHRAAEIADRLGARPLRDRIHKLARRARLTENDEATLGLTPRELEVLRQVAEGRSNREIATALFISVKTASVHVSNILGKLDVTSRGEAAAAAHRLGLANPPPA